MDLIMFFNHLNERYQVVVPPTIHGLIQKLCVILILAIFCVHAGAQGAKGQRN